MGRIPEIVKYLTRGMPPDYPWGEVLKNSHRSTMLFELFTKADVTTDKQAEEIVRVSGAPTGYIAARGRLLQKVFAVAVGFMIDESEQPKLVIAHHSCSLKRSICFLLLAVGRRDYAMDLIKGRGGLLTKAKEFGLTDHIQFCLTELLKSSALRGAHSEFNKLARELEICQSILTIETKALIEIEMLKCSLAKTSNVSAELKEHASIVRDKLSSLVEEAAALNKETFPLYQLNMLRYEAERIFYEVIQDHVKLLDVLNRQYQYLHDHSKLSNKTMLGKILTRRATIHYKSGSFSQGLQNSDMALIQFEDYGFNWLMAARWKLLNLSHLGKFGLALDFCEHVLDHTHKSYSGSNSREFFSAAKLVINITHLKTTSYPQLYPTSVSTVEKFVAGRFGELQKDTLGFSLVMMLMTVLLMMIVLNSNKATAVQQDHVFFNYCAKISRFYKSRLRSTPRTRTKVLLGFAANIEKSMGNPSRLTSNYQKAMQELDADRFPSMDRREPLELVPYDIVLEQIYTMALKMAGR